MGPNKKMLTFLYRWPGAGLRMEYPTTGYPYDHPYGSDGYNKRNIKEERITTVLQKGSRGFGFTIVGGDHPDELLQVKSIVPGGPASIDGKIRIGDALVKVNGMSVVGRSHRDVVGMFQSMPHAEEVELDLVRGHPLPFDPDDPNIHSIGSYTVVPPAHDDLGPPPSFESNGPNQVNGEFADGHYKDTLQLNRYSKPGSLVTSGNSAFDDPRRGNIRDHSNRPVSGKMIFDLFTTTLGNGFPPRFNVY